MAGSRREHVRKDRSSPGTAISKGKRRHGCNYGFTKGIDWVLDDLYLKIFCRDETINMEGLAERYKGAWKHL